MLSLSTLICCFHFSSHADAKARVHSAKDTDADEQTLAARQPDSFQWLPPCPDGQPPGNITADS